MKHNITHYKVVEMTDKISEKLKSLQPEIKLKAPC